MPKPTRKRVPANRIRRADSRDKDPEPREQVALRQVTAAPSSAPVARREGVWKEAELRVPSVQGSGDSGGECRQGVTSSGGSWGGYVVGSDDPSAQPVPGPPLLGRGQVWGKASLGVLSPTLFSVKTKGGSQLCCRPSRVCRLHKRVADLLGYL